MTTGDARTFGAIAGAVERLKDQDYSYSSDDREVVGDSDAEADAVRSGGKGSLRSAERDGDGVPVGDADADQDAIRSGADPAVRHG